MPQLGSVPSKQVQIKHITDRGLGEKPYLLGNFCNTSENKAILTLFGSTSHPFRAISKTNLIQFENHLKKLNISALSYPHVTHMSGLKLILPYPILFFMKLTLIILH